ncbi:MAG: Crp/Fnr family transcriptional regulator [Muribaculaceae bacterium]|nr:Crp/Fnr family transcriptional regulator [Muribaculaceae bacterium]MDE6462039.1 Crp/Fnr family transcriptional regulator [Muribaculaceae bacterium]
MARLNEFFSRIDTDLMLDYCMRHGDTAFYARGEHFAQEGELCRYIGFVRRGYFKYSRVTSKGEEAVNGFTFCNEVVGDYVMSFLHGRPAMCSIIAGADSEVIQVPVKALRDYVAGHSPNFMIDTASVVLMEAYRRYTDLHTLTPQERYGALLERYPHVIDEIPLQEIASFLNVSRRQFQRIREIFR